MRRLWTFVLGMVVGGLLLFGALNYHVLNTKQGLKLVPKVNSTLAQTYVDVRQYRVADWLKNADLALALSNSGQQDLMENAAGDALQNGLNRLLDHVEER